MSDLVQADIFFFITSVAVIAVTIAILAVFYYVIPIARDLRDIVAKVRRAGEEVEKDFDALRESLREEGAKGKAAASLALGFLVRKLTPPGRPRRKPEADSPEL